jgi:hypothetical protein
VQPTLTKPAFTRSRRAAQSGRRSLTPADRCRRKFLRYFKAGFHDPKYVDWERGYKWTAHTRWTDALGKDKFQKLLGGGEHEEIARRAMSIESRTNLLFSFEKMALRDALRSPTGARRFAEALFDFLYGDGSAEARFDRWRGAVAELPRRQTRVLTWPLLTVFGFIAQPDRHIFLKPNVTRRAADLYGSPLLYRSSPNWGTYANLLELARKVKADQRDLRPRDLIDVQSFLWVQGSDEYPD